MQQVISFSTDADFHTTRRFYFRGNEKVQSAIFIYVERADVVGFLVAGDKVVGEFSFAIVFEPPRFFVAVRAGGGVEVAIGIHIENDERVRFFERVRVSMDG